jgi:hypothetical protein
MGGEVELDFSPDAGVVMKATLQSFRGSKSRNKVSVGEPEVGSLPRVVGFCPPWVFDTGVI